MLSIALESPDQPAVIALIAALDAYQASLYPPESCHALDLAALTQPGVLFAVLRDDAGRAVGCGAIVPGPAAGNGAADGEGCAYGEVKRMYVSPSHRGRRAGQRLLAWLEDQAAQRGCRLLRLETGPYQPEALALYARAGYQRRPPFGGYRDDPLSVFMEKPLPG